MEVTRVFDIAVVGAGPAGSAAAIAAAARGLRVLLLEAGQYPRHKVCGEFVSSESAEVLRYLLGEESTLLFASPRIAKARLHARGASCEIALAAPGYSISRKELDNALWQCARLRGVECRMERVKQVCRERTAFLVATGKHEYRATQVVNASGRWSRLSRRSRGESWVGLKAHFAGDADDAVDLYFFRGGYCGVQAVEPGTLNACALVRQGTARDLNDVFRLDPRLSARSRGWLGLTEIFATAPVYLGVGEAVSNGMLQAGDAAGFVDPFVGDGISLALRSGVLAGRCVGEVSAETYARLYHRAFGAIFRSTQRIRSLQTFPALLHPLIVRGLSIPPLARRIFHQTRGAKLNVMRTPLADLS